MEIRHDGKAKITLWVDAANWLAVRRRALEEGTTASAILEAAIETALAQGHPSRPASGSAARRSQVEQIPGVRRGIAEEGLKPEPRVVDDEFSQGRRRS